MIERTLLYGKLPLRVLISAEGAWFAAKDIFAAHGLSTRRALLAYFAPEHLRLSTFTSEEGPVRLTAVSPLGVATIAASLPFPLCRVLDSWVRKVVLPLSEEFGFAPLGMTLLADGCLPVRPRSYSAREDAWYGVKFKHPHGEPRRANLAEPALFDGDPDLPPHDPAADIPEFQVVRAAEHRRDIPPSMGIPFIPHYRR